MARKIREDSLKTRAQLLDAAEEVFFHKGFSGSTLEDVARAASVTRGAIYWHFRNKTDLFMAMVERVRLPIEALAEAACCEGKNPLEQLREVSIRILRETATNPRRRRVLTVIFQRCELVGEMTELEMRQRAACVDCIGRIEQSLARAVEVGQLPPTLPLKQTAFVWHAFLMGVINHWLFSPEAFDLAANAARLVDQAMPMLQGAGGLTQQAA